MNTSARNIAAGLIPVLGSAVLAGCGATPQAAPTAPSTMPSTSTTATTSATLAPTSTTATTVTSSATRLCRAADVRFSLAYGGAGMGNDYTVLVTTNHSATACSLQGYPALMHLIGTTAVGHLADHDPGQRVTTVVLRPGERAGATFDETNAYNYPGSACRMLTATALRVQLPGDASATVLLHRAQICTTAQYSWSVQAYTRNFTTVR